MKPIDLIGKLSIFPFLLLIWIYRKLISPLLPPSCRYYPSCSEYSRQAFERFGLLGGCYLSVRRLLRCNPFFPGGIDEVPDSISFLGFRQTDRDRV